MKIKKTLAALAAAAVAVTMCAGLAACGNGGGGDTDIPEKPDKNPTGGSSITIEAEYIELENVSGAGISSNQSGIEMIYGTGEQEDKDKGWSNGYYVGYTYTKECVMEFVFESDKETTAQISIRLASELGDLTLTPREFEITLNGSTMNYGSWSVRDSGGGMAGAVFNDYIVGQNAKIVKGENKLVVSVKDNTLYNDKSIGAPLIDCVKVKTSDATVTYNPIDNPAHKGEI